MKTMEKEMGTRESFRSITFEEIFGRITEGVYRAEPLALGPDVCRSILDLNIHNRPMQPRHVAKLAGMMTGGLWESRNGDTITFDVQQRLVDGQHRLQAASDAEFTLRTLVVFGAAVEAFGTKDQGKARTAGDLLAIEGEKNTMTLGAALQIVWRLEQNPSYNKSLRLPKPMLSAVLARHPDLRDALLFVNNKETGSICPKSLAAACLYVFRQKDREAADRFLESLASGANLETHSPILRLRNRMIQEKGKRSWVDAETIAVWFKAWNAYREGRTMKALGWKDGVESFPVPK